MKLEFGNPEHIAIAQKGLICICGHAFPDHSFGGGSCQNEDEDEDEFCECMTFKNNKS